jgi:hypothetical protein
MFINKIYNDEVKISYYLLLFSISMRVSDLFNQ